MKLSTVTRKCLNGNFPRKPHFDVSDGPFDWWGPTQGVSNRSEEYRKLESFRKRVNTKRKAGTWFKLQGGE